MIESTTAGPISRLAEEIESIAQKGFGDRSFVQACAPALRRLLSEKDFLPEGAKEPSEKGYARDLAERALAHTISNQTEAAYHRTDLLDQRRGMMEAWAQFVCGMPDQGDNIVPISRGAPSAN